MAAGALGLAVRRLYQGKGGLPASRQASQKASIRFRTASEMRCRPSMFVYLISNDRRASCIWNAVLRPNNDASKHCHLLSSAHRKAVPMHFYQP